MDRRLEALYICGVFWLVIGLLISVVFDNLFRLFGDFMFYIGVETIFIVWTFDSWDKYIDNKDTWSLIMAILTTTLLAVSIYIVLGVV